MKYPTLPVKSKNKSLRERRAAPVNAVKQVRQRHRGLESLRKASAYGQVHIRGYCGLALFPSCDALFGPIHQFSKLGLGHSETAPKKAQIPTTQARGLPQKQSSYALLECVWIQILDLIPVGRLDLTVSAVQVQVGECKVGIVNHGSMTVMTITCCSGTKLAATRISSLSTRHASRNAYCVGPPMLAIVGRSLNCPLSSTSLIWRGS